MQHLDPRGERPSAIVPDVQDVPIRALILQASIKAGFRVHAAALPYSQRLRPCFDLTQPESMRGQVAFTPEELRVLPRYALSR